MERLTKTYSDGTHGASDSLPCGENSRTYSGVKPIEPIRCAYEPDKACTPACKYYKTCIHSVHKK